MKIGLPMPAVTLVTRANCTFADAGSEAALTDGQPANVCRINVTGASPSLQLTFGAAFTPGVICLLGLTCAPGTIITATTGAGGALGGNSAGQAAVQLADGSVACWIVTSGAVATDTVKITIGVGAGVIDIGELAVMAAVEAAHTADWAYSRVDPSNSARTRGGQVVTSVRRSYRTLRVALSPAAIAEVRGGGLAGGQDWDQVSAALVADARCAAIPRWRTPAGAIDAAELHATAVYGVARQGGVAHVGGDYYGTENGLTFEEVPPR